MRSAVGLDNGACTSALTRSCRSERELLRFGFDGRGTVLLEPEYLRWSVAPERAHPFDSLLAAPLQTVTLKLPFLLKAYR